MTGLDRPDALIFDLDGTLWDAAVPTARGWNDALVDLGVSSRVTVEGIRSVAGTPFLGCVEVLVPEICPPTEAMLVAIDSREEEAIRESGGTLFAGVESGLERLASLYPLYLVSNCQDWYIGLFFEKTGLDKHFTGHDCNGCSGLPKAEMLGRLAQKEGLRRAVYVGDTKGDQQSATRAGMTFVFARYGFGSVEGSPLGFDDFSSLVEHFVSIDTGSPT